MLAYQNITRKVQRTLAEVRAGDPTGRNLLQGPRSRPKHAEEKQPDAVTPVRRRGRRKRGAVQSPLHYKQQAGRRPGATELPAIR